MNFSLTVVTPEGALVFHGVKSVLFQTPDGERGILAGHEPMICLVDAGLLRVTSVQADEWFATGEGLVRVDGGGVTLLVHEFAADSQVDEAAAAAARDHALRQLALPEIAITPAARDELRRELRHAEACLALLRRRPGRRG